MNEVLRQNTSDVLIQLRKADLSMEGREVLENLVKPFMASGETYLVCGDHAPLSPKTFVEKLAFFGCQGVGIELLAR